MSGRRIKVWDSFVRLFHWSLVVSFAIAYVTEEELLSLHLAAGYTVAGLVGLRLVWGCVGSRYARFSNFVYRPARIKAYLRDILRFRARRYIGHNPAGGAMILLMLAALLLSCLSGVALYGIEGAAGPLATLSPSWKGWGEAMEGVHEFLASFTLLLVAIHVAGVLLESIIHQENLVKAMLTGFKRAG
jgi:cytochrome b